MKHLSPSALAPIAVRGRHAGELLAQPCGCSTRRHRWRSTGCARCVDGLVLDADSLTRLACPECWVACEDGNYFDAETQAFRPCPLCKPHTLGEHVWQTTKDVAPGPRAQRTDAGRGRRLEAVDLGAGPELVEIPGNDPVGEAVIAVMDGDDDAHVRYVDAIAAYERAADDLEVLLGKYRPDREVKLPKQSGEEEFCRHHMATIGVWEPRYRGDECRFCYDFRLARGMKPPEEILKIKSEGGRRLTDRDVADAIRAERARQKRAGKGGKKGKGKR